MNAAQFVTELAIAVPVSAGVANGLNADALITALITFGVSVVTLVGGELIKFLVAFFNKKTDDLTKKTDDLTKKDSQTDEDDKREEIKKKGGIN